MLSADDIRVLIVLRLQVLNDTCNSTAIAAIMGQIRGLVAALTGTPCGPYATGTEVCQAAGIPFTVVGRDEFEFSDEWLIAHGCTIDEDDDIHHPTLGESW